MALYILLTRFLPGKHHVCQFLPTPPLPHSELFPSEEKEKQANEHVKYIFCGSPLGSSVAMNQYVPHFIVNA